MLNNFFIELYFNKEKYFNDDINFLIKLILENNDNILKKYDKMSEHLKKRY